MDITANKKKIKNQRNLNVKSNSDEDKSFERLRNLVLKTEEMKEEAFGRNQQMEDHFQELQERLSSTSLFLNQMKRSIQEIKFPQIREVPEVEQVTEHNRQDIDKKIAELREKVNKLKWKANNREIPEPQNYQEAYTDVLNTFQDLGK